MIFVWRGKGLLALLPLFGIPALLILPSAIAIDQQQAIAQSFPFFTVRVASVLMIAAILVGWFAGGAVCFLLGLRWNWEENNHHLFFVPVQYLGLGLCLLEVAVIGW